MHFSPLHTRNRKEQNSSESGIILYLDEHLKRQKNMHNCIFCGNTSPHQNFKGKSVCLDCLQSIPELFSFPTIMSQNSR